MGARDRSYEELLGENEYLSLRLKDAEGAACDAEARLRKLDSEMEKRVAARTAQLEKTTEELRAEIADRKADKRNLLRLTRLYAVLSQTNQAIVHANAPESLFKAFCSVAVNAGSFILAWVGLVDRETGLVKVVAAEGATGYLEDITITVNREPSGLGPTGIAVRDGTYFICNDFQGSEVTRPWHERGAAYGLRASASIALRREGEVMGALTLYADTKDFFDPGQVDLLVQMGSDISFALSNMAREARTREAEAALQQEAAERARAVESLREKEQMLIHQSRLAAMGEMIGNIAHQWRQPLNLLGLTAQQLLLAYDLGECDRAYVTEIVQKEMQIIQHMSQTINDFQDYFKPAREKTRFRVGEAITSTLSLLKGSLHNHGVKVEVLTPEDPVITGHPNEFAQVLLNIVINANDVFRERKIQDPTLTIASSLEGDRAVLTIADNGGGIPEDVMDRIFDPYFTTKGTEGGTGIGLFMAKSIIEKNMGGRLSVRNLPKGAEFRVEV